MSDAHELQLRRAALEVWGEQIGLVPEEIARLQELEPALQDAAVAKDGCVFVDELRNSYHCEDCDTSWSDAWCCACDDDCPACGDAHTPEGSEVVSVEIIALSADRCSVCGSVHEF